MPLNIFRTYYNNVWKKRRNLLKTGKTITGLWYLSHNTLQAWRAQHAVSLLRCWARTSGSSMSRSQARAHGPPGPVVIGISCPPSSAAEALSQATDRERPGLPSSMYPAGKHHKNSEPWHLSWTWLTGRGFVPVETSWGSRGLLPWPRTSNWEQEGTFVRATV